MKEVLIIGAGPAGLTAALYLARYGYKAIVFEGLQHGGQVATTFEVENYPTIEKITGYDFATKLYDQAVNLGVAIIPQHAIKVESNAQTKTVFTADNKYEGSALIVATGAKRRKLNCPGEEKFSGIGVSYCATCDGNFFRGKEVAIVGGGNTALEDALFLANVCTKVHLIHRSKNFRGIKTLIDAVLASPNIEVIYDAQVTAIEGDTSVETVQIKTDNDTLSLKVSGIFVAIGTEPNNGFLADLITMDKQGYIIADENCTTNVEGVFVAGDSRTKKLRQIVTATADGGVSAFMAASYLSLK